MIFQGRPIFLFLAIVAGVESFSTTLTSINSRNVAFCSTKVCEPTKFGKEFVLYSEQSEVTEASEEAADVADVAAVVEEKAEEKVEQKKPVQVVEDITKIAYVVNLSYDTPGYKLREIFNEHGTVEKLFMPKEKTTGKLKGIAFVTMASEEERDLTIEKLNGIEVDGRTVYVDKAKPRSEKSEKADPLNKKLYVGNISYETTKDELTEFFGTYGAVEDAYIPLDKHSNLPRGFAFVTMKTADADAAIEGASGTDLQGRTIDVKESLPRGQKTPNTQPRVSKKDNETKLYIGNLSFDTEEDTLRSVFEEFGTLIDLYQPLDRYSGRPRGFAFITMDKDSAGSAIEATDGLELDGRILRVNEAQPKGYSPPRYNDWDDEGDWGEEEE